MCAGLTFGKAIAGIMAQAKGRSIGKILHMSLRNIEMYTAGRHVSAGLGYGPLA